MDGTRGYYVKYNEADRERQILYNFICVWDLKKQNKLANITKQKQNQRFREQTVPRRRGLRG